MYRNPFGFIDEQDVQIMAFLTGYFDESGKVSDAQPVITIAGFLSESHEWDWLHHKWIGLLNEYGIPELKAAQAIRYTQPFGKKISAQGKDARAAALVRFVQAARMGLRIGLGSAVDANAFRALDSESQRQLKRDPYYAAFYALLVRIELFMAEKYGSDTRVGLMFDEDSSTSVRLLEIFIGLKATYPKVRDRFVSIGFGNSKYLPELQAADLLAAMTRKQAEKLFFGKPFDMESVYREFIINNGEWCEMWASMLNPKGLKELAKRRGDPFAVA